jgi:predicted fused transcriptional regulator/phosphomethylpyrimidine kinase
MKVKYSHEWLENCKLIGYLVKKQIAKNKVLNVNLFDEIILIQRVEDVVHAIGYRGLKPTILIFTTQVDI